MPLLDHFHAPLAPQRHWESFHARWASALADLLNQELLPSDYFAEPHCKAGGPVEIDVATFEKAPVSSSRAGNGAPATLASRPWSPPAAALVMPAVFPGHLEVKVFHDEGGATLAGAIELVSPSNKDRQETRRAFAVKCASYLYQGVGLIVVDIVTSRGGNLHDEIIRVMESGEAYLFQPTSLLYAVAYRPLRREQITQVEMWPTALSVGSPLPPLPLWLSGELCLPIDLEATYADSCRLLRLI